MTEETITLLKQLRTFHNGTYAKAIDEAIASAEPKMVFCKDCTHFHYDYWSDVNGVPLIVGHEICDFWGNGCKTRSDAFCSFAEEAEE